MVAKFKIIRDKTLKDCVGYGNSHEIGVNVELLWKDEVDKAEVYFIKEFCATYTHELLHQVICPIAPKKESVCYGEEKAIYVMLDETWDEETDLFYRNYVRDNNGKTKM